MPEAPAIHAVAIEPPEVAVRWARSVRPSMLRGIAEGALRPYLSVDVSHETEELE